MVARTLLLAISHQAACGVRIPAAHENQNIRIMEELFNELPLLVNELDGAWETLKSKIENNKQ